MKFFIIYCQKLSNKMGNHLKRPNFKFYNWKNVPTENLLLIICRGEKIQSFYIKCLAYYYPVRKSKVFTSNNALLNKDDPE